MVKYNKLIYFLYLVGLHSVCIFFSVSCFWFPALSIVPYVFRYNFPYVPISKKLILTGLLITNETLILAYTALIHKMMA